MTATENRQKAFSGTKDVADALAFDADKLLAYAGPRIETFKAPVTVRQFKGGQSNPTYLLQTGGGNFVLRRKPPGKLLASAHAVDREFRVIAALHKAGFPVAHPYLLCEDPEVIGTPFYIMGHVDGRIQWDPDLPEFDRAERSAIFDQMNATLARLHSFDPGEIGLGDFGKPGGYVARQVKRWSENYRLSETRSIPEMDKLIGWLPDHLPTESRAALVHGDYRLDNMVLDKTQPKILAVLDWELATLGDPIADFVYHTMTWVMPRVPNASAGTATLIDCDFDALGIPRLDAYLEAYAKRMNLSEIPSLEFYQAYNFFRLAAILQGITGRVRDGTASNERAAAVGELVQPLAVQGLMFAEKVRG